MLRKITNIDEVFDYLEKNDYLESDTYMIYDYSHDSENVEVKLENEKISITFAFKEIINNWCNVKCTNVDGFELWELIFFEEKEGIFNCSFSDEFGQEIFVKFKQIEIIIEDIEDIS